MNLKNLFTRTKKSENLEKRDINYISNNIQAYGYEILNKDVAPLALSAFYRGLNLISDSLASLKFSVKHVDGDDVPLNQHPLNMIFNNRTDSNLTFFELIKVLIISVILNGDAFAYIYRDGDGNAKKLRFLPYGTVNVEYDSVKDILYYKCTNITKQRIEPKNIIHLKMFSRDAIHGISLVKSMWRSLQIGSFADETAKEFFNKGGSKMGYLKSDKPVSPEQKEEAIQNWNRSYNGYGNKVPVLGNNFDFVQLNENAAEAQLLETRNFTVQEIARYFGISPELLGDLSGSSYSSIEASLIQFLTNTLKPWIVMLEQEFTKKLLRPSEIDLVVNIDERKLLMTDKNSMSNYLKTLVSSGILSINEARKELELAPIDGGDEHYLPYTDLAANKVGDENNSDEIENQDEDIEN